MKKLLFIFMLFVLAACTTVYCEPVPVTQQPPTEIPTTQQPTNIPTIIPPTTLPTSTPIARVDNCTPIFYNVNGVGLSDELELKRHFDVLKPCGATVMDNFGLAIWMAERGTKVAVRSYSGAEGSQCITDDPVNQVNRYYNELNRLNPSPTARENLYYYGCSNEPSYGNNWPIQDILRAEIRGMLRANELGVHVCSGNWGVGNFDPNHVDAGVYDEYLEVLINGGHLLCIHEYTSMTLAFGVGMPLTRADLLDPTKVQPENWATVDQIKPERIFLPAIAQNAADVPFGIERMADYYAQPRAQADGQYYLPPYWHLFRVYWLFIRAHEKGLPYPYVMITEGLHDHLEDINRQEPMALRILEGAWGMVVYDKNLRGAPSHCNLWENFYYPQWSCEEAYLQQLLWWDMLRDPHIIAVNIFTWTHNDMWKSFNLSNRQMQVGRTFDVFAFRRMLESCYGQIPHCRFTLDS